jgi:hypothetical protein
MELLATLLRLGLLLLLLLLVHLKWDPWDLTPRRLPLQAAQAETEAETPLLWKDVYLLITRARALTAAAAMRVQGQVPVEAVL